MKAIFLKSIFIISIFFILMGIGTIAKGDVETIKEGLIMAGYLLIFSILVIFSKPKKRSKLESPIFK